MRPVSLGAILAASTVCLIFGQSTDTRPRFVIADVHPNTGTGYPYSRALPVHDFRYEVVNSTIVDMVRIAYGFDADKIVGGPSWLEMNHYDVTAKLPGETSPDDQKLMLQALLEDRFKLVVHKETKPIPGYALTAGKKPALKEAAGTEASGCNPQASTGPTPEGGMRLMMSNNGVVTTIVLGPGGAIQYNCRNITMAAFAAGLRNMPGSGVGTSPVRDETGLTGKYNFDLNYSIGLIMPAGNSDAPRLTIMDAIDKQLGMKLEKKDIPTPVLVVDSVNEKPSDNSPDLAREMPPMLPATAFDVASIKPSDPSVTSARFQTQQERLTVQGYPMSSLITMAFRDPLSLVRMQQPKGVPGWANSARFDITAKAPPDTAPLDSFNIMVPLRALLVERFKLAYHTEQQPGTSYTLEAVKPKLKKSDPASRSSCKANAVAGPPVTETLVCQNMTMTQVAAYLSTVGLGVSGPVTDATGLDGAWDFTLSFSPVQNTAAASNNPGAGQPGAQAPSAADPDSGYTIFEAMEKQLGLKLVTQKTPQPVIVIDHIEEKPTDDQ